MWTVLINLNRKGSQEAARTQADNGRFRNIITRLKRWERGSLKASVVMGNFPGMTSHDYIERSQSMHHQILRKDKMVEVQAVAKFTHLLLIGIPLTTTNNKYIPYGMTCSY